MPEGHNGSLDLADIDVKRNAPPEGWTPTLVDPEGNKSDRNSDANG